MPTPSTVTASVSDPTPIPERPTLYATIYPCAINGIITHWEVGNTYKKCPSSITNYPVGSIVVTIPGSAEQASKDEPAQCMFREGSIRCYKYAGEFSDFCPDHTPAPTPKAEPKPKRGHVCDTRCMGDSGHHSWPAPRPDECLCNQELAGRPVFCPSCANKPKPDQSVDITDMIPKPADEGKVERTRWFKGKITPHCVWEAKPDGTCWYSSESTPRERSDLTLHQLAIDSCVEEFFPDSPPQSPAEAAGEGEWLPEGIQDSHDYWMAWSKRSRFHEASAPGGTCIIDERDRQWRTECARLTRERDEAKAEATTTRCGHCDATIAKRADPQWREKVASHAKVCDKHPSMLELARLRAENQQQAEEIEELKAKNLQLIVAHSKLTASEKREA